MRTRRAFWARHIGTGTEFQIVTQTGAGAYEVGEESALMESLEGKRGVPRIKPPFPAVVGLYGGPTVINNAETIATVPHVIRWARQPMPPWVRHAMGERGCSA